MWPKIEWPQWRRSAIRNGNGKSGQLYRLGDCGTGDLVTPFHAQDTAL